MDTKEPVLTLKWEDVQKLDFHNVFLIALMTISFGLFSYYVLPYYYSGKITLFVLFLLNAALSITWIGIFKLAKNYVLQKELVFNGVQVC